ncbi:MAG: CorA family divalent cation transporter [Planctomycetota bacterium]
MDEPKEGLDFRLQLDGEGGAREVPAGNNNELVWRHYRLETGADRVPILMQHEDIDESLAHALMIENARPRATPLGKGILVILRGVNFNPGSDPEDMVSLRLWVQPDRILSLCPRRVFAVETVNQELAAGRGPKSATQTLVALTTALIERMADIIDDLVEKVEDLQTQLLQEPPSDLPHQLSELRCSTALMRRHLAPQRDALLRLYREPVNFLQEKDITLLREVADRNMRYVEDLDSVRERAAYLQDELHHHAATALNRNTYLLSIVAAVFLPLGLLTGLLGINVGGMPGEDDSTAFWIVSAGLLILALLELWLLKKLKMF